MSNILEDILWMRGDSYPLPMVVSSKATKQIIDITGYTFVLTVDENQDPEDDTTQVFSVDGVIEDALGGKVSFTPSETDTDFAKGGYYYDIQMVDTSGNKKTIIKAKWKHDQDITKV